MFLPMPCPMRPAPIKPTRIFGLMASALRLPPRRPRKAIASRTAERQIRNHLGNAYLAESSSGGVKANDPILTACPEISGGVEPETIGNAWADLREYSAFRQLAVIGNRKGADVMRAIGIMGET